MIKVAIVEDTLEDQERLVESLNYTSQKLNVSFMIEKFDTGLKFLSNFKNQYDIIFMDIEMPLIDGIDTAKKIRNLDKNVLLIFVTNLAKMAIKGYEVEAFDFLVKPVNKEMFLLKIERALPRITNKLGEKIIIKCKGEIVSLSIDSIKYIESDSHYVIFHSTDGNYKEYATLKETEKRINCSYFARCNQCYLINLKHVSKFIDNDVYVGNDKLNMSRHQKKYFINEYTKYLAGGLLWHVKEQYYYLLNH